MFPLPGPYRDIAVMLTGFEDEVTLAFPDNMEAYFVNLNRLGIVEIHQNLQIADDSFYKPLEKRYEPDDDNRKSWDPKYWDFRFVRGKIQVTDFGTLFLDACLKKLVK